MVDEGDEDGVHAAAVATGEVGVLVAGVVLDALIADGDDGVGEGLDAVAGGLGDGDFAFGGEEGVVRVVGGVEEVLMVELAEDEDHEEVTGGHGILRMGLEDGLEPGDGAFVVEDVEVLEAFVDDGVEVEGVGVEAGVRLLGVAGGREEDDGGEDRYGCGMKTGRPACDARPGLCCCGDANPHSTPCTGQMASL